MNDLIQWPRAKYWDKAWNPVIGCQAVSPACDNCWARDWARRFGQSFKPHWTEPKPVPRGKGVVFCGNLTDLFGEWMEEENIGELLEAVEFKGSAKATYLWLTKRADRMAEVLSRFSRGMVNQCFGITAETCPCWNARWPAMKRIPEWANWWISVEPMLGPIFLGLPYMKHPPQWVVVGCESGPNRRPCGMGWVESIAAQCMNAKIPLFIKQLDINGRCETDIDKFPAHLRIRQVPWAKKGEE